jgi:hypothetical protein
LATIYEGQAKYLAATREVTAYLDTEDRQYRELAKPWLSRLQAAADGSHTARID